MRHSQASSSQPNTRAALGAAFAVIALAGALPLAARPSRAGQSSDFAARESAMPRVFFQIEVRAGERVQDFCTRCGSLGLSCEDLDKRAHKAKWFAAQRGRLRFEGIFVPGVYRAGVPAQYAKYRGYVADKLFEALMERAKERIGSAGGGSLQNIVLASIVQKESVSGQNYQEVASVFRNRLMENMPLGSCPTVEYALGYHRPFLTATDVSIDSPYNVYKRKGLPPAPIAFFSDEAWQAVQSTPRTPYKFFVYDWTTRRLHFSKDYGTHQRLASAARANYVRRFGEGALRQVHRDRFYE